MKYGKAILALGACIGAYIYTQVPQYDAAACSAQLRTYSIVGLTARLNSMAGNVSNTNIHDVVYERYKAVKLCGEETVLLEETSW